MIEVDETVSQDQLKNNSGNYLNGTIGKPHAPTPKYGLENTSNNPELEQLIQLVKPQIQNIDYRDIDFINIGADELGLDTYEIVLPDEVDDNVKKIIDNLQRRERDESAQSWYFQIDCRGEQRFNRIHFNNPLPYELRGTGFGFKIYKAFITIKGFASSAIDSSDDARRVWIKLVQESDFECIIDSTELLILNKKLHNKLSIAKQFIEFHQIHLNSSDTVISETLLNQIKPYIPATLGGLSHDKYEKPQQIQANTDLKIGDNVWVFDIHNNVITNNDQLAHKLGAKNWKRGVNDLQEYDAVKIENLTFNQGENIALAYSPRTKKEYLINVEGLEKEHNQTAA